MEDEEYRLVLNTNTYEPTYHVDGSVLVERISDGYQFYVDPSIIASECMDLAAPPVPSEPEPITSLSKETSLVLETEKHWSRNEILQLISEYKINKENFASTTIKNTKVWQKIANTIKTHDAKQCENKFKYLKSKYLKKVDNMSNKSSGAGALSFEYFDEFNEIFAKQPIVTPVIASSSRDNNDYSVEMDTGDNTAGESAPPNMNPEDRPTKNIRLRTAINNLNKILETAEENKEKRHQEIIRIHQESLDTFKNLMEKIIEKL